MRGGKTNLKSDERPKHSIAYLPETFLFFVVRYRISPTFSQPLREGRVGQSFECQTKGTHTRVYFLCKFCVSGIHYRPPTWRPVSLLYTHVKEWPVRYAGSSKRCVTCIWECCRVVYYLSSKRCVKCFSECCRVVFYLSAVQECE